MLKLKTFQADLPSLEDLLFVGNPLEESLQSTEKGYRDTVQEKLLKLKKLDGELKLWEIFFFSFQKNIVWH